MEPGLPGAADCDGAVPVKSGAEVFRLRLARREDAEGLRKLIEASVHQLQRNDYTPAQIEGALGHALGLDTQLIDDGTYFVAETHA